MNFRYQRRHKLLNWTKLIFPIIIRSPSTGKSSKLYVHRISKIMLNKKGKDWKKIREKIILKSLWDGKTSELRENKLSSTIVPRKNMSWEVGECIKSTHSDVFIKQCLIISERQSLKIVVLWLYNGLSGRFPSCSGVPWRRDSRDLL
jgi:hypothetical protein